MLKIIHKSDIGQKW